MEKHYQHLTRIVLPVVCVLLLAGCVKDDCKRTYTIYTPVYKALKTLRAEVQTQAARSLENPGKIYIIGDRIYLNERDKGIHVIDNSNPQQPRNTAFINVPGNIDIAMKNNILYADMYCDLATLDVSAGNTTVKKFVTNVFSSKMVYTGNGTYNSNTTNPDSIKVIVDWATKDTVLSCEAYNWLMGCTNCGIFFSSSSAVSQSATKSNGTAGSMARFSTVGDYLYALDYSAMNIIDIADAANPLFLKRKYLSANSETVYSFKNNLFIGQPTGMSIYDIQSPADPQLLSISAHWQKCDPVIADDNYAYVTIYDGRNCGGGAPFNQLDIYDIKNLSKPVLVKSYSLTNPHGLSKDGNLLFICDGKDGLKVFDASNVQELKLLKHITGIDTYDVITLNGIAYVVTKDGLYQYDYSNPGQTHMLSKLQWSKKID